MKLVVRYMLLGLLLVFAEAFYICWFSFRYDKIITLISYGLLLIGWGLIIYSMTWNYFSKIKNNMVLKMVYGALISGSVWLFSSVADVRISYILTHHPVNTTVATVLTTKTYRNSSAATLQYYVPTGIIQKEISNKNFEYKPGRKFVIKYSVEYPELFTVIKQVDSN